MAEGELEILPPPGLQQNDAQRPTQGQIQINIFDSSFSKHWYRQKYELFEGHIMKCFMSFN